MEVKVDFLEPTSLAADRATRNRVVNQLAIRVRGVASITELSRVAAGLTSGETAPRVPRITSFQSGSPASSAAPGWTSLYVRAK